MGPEAMKVATASGTATRHSAEKGKISGHETLSGVETASGVNGKRTQSRCGGAVTNPSLVAGVHEGEVRRSDGDQVIWGIHNHGTQSGGGVATTSLVGGAHEEKARWSGVNGKRPWSGCGGAMTSLFGGVHAGKVRRSGGEKVIWGI